MWTISLEQAADDFPHTAQFVGELLVGGMEALPLAQQQGGESLVELAEGHFLDQLHQIGNALGKQLEDEIAEGLLPQQGLEVLVGHDQQGGVGFGDAAGVVGAWPSRQAEEMMQVSPGVTR
jgi:hypothetical protein